MTIGTGAGVLESTKYQRVLAIIPARGNSKGIPRKNARLMNGKPLLAYSIANAFACQQITTVVVTTDDDELASIARDEGAIVIRRGPGLARDDVTLDPVVYDAVQQAERELSVGFDVVVTLQPTSPLLKPKTLASALESFQQSDADSLISAVNSPHLSWSATEDGFVPDFTERLNRQWLPAHLVETGAFLISKRTAVTATSRLGRLTTVYIMDASEGIDIDDANDWLVCESTLRRQRIALRADGHRALGMGHIYHCLTLAYRLMGHDVHFITTRRYTEGVDLLHESNFPVHLIDDDRDLYELLGRHSFDVLVNDCLDTTPRYVQKLKSLVPRVVTIEDLGDGARHADAVVNALYDGYPINSHHYFGERFVCLRDEFIAGRPSEFREQVGSVVVMFGGTDPANLTARIYDLARRLNRTAPTARFDFILGPGYDESRSAINDRPAESIFVHRTVKRVSALMRGADLAITSQGRTVYELAALGVPAIVIAQNDREQLHTFAQMRNGFINLGLASSVSNESIERTFKWLVDASQVRCELRNSMARHDLKGGVDRVARIILGEAVD